MIFIGLSLLVLLCALAHIWGEYRGPMRIVYFFKPLTVVLILCVALIQPTEEAFYKYLLLAGLCFSLVGDVFLMLPDDRFVAGLTAFLIAHLFYIAAFASNVVSPVWWPLVPLVGCGALIYPLLYPKLGALKIPVFFYVVVILFMAWMAWSWWTVIQHSHLAKSVIQ